MGASSAFLTETIERISIMSQGGDEGRCSRHVMNVESMTSEKVNISTTIINESD